MKKIIHEFNRKSNKRFYDELVIQKQTNNKQRFYILWTLTSSFFIISFVAFAVKKYYVLKLVIIFSLVDFADCAYYFKSAKFP